MGVPVGTDHWRRNVGGYPSDRGEGGEGKMEKREDV